MTGEGVARTGPAAGTVDDVTAVLTGRERVSQTIYLLEFEPTRPPAGTTGPLPGQFYQVDCGGGREHLLRRPLSVHGVDGHDGAWTLRFLVQVVGWGTQKLAAAPEGTSFSMLGPLGRPFDLDTGGRTLMVAGGMGIAPLFFAARELEAAGVECDFLAGFSTGDDYYPRLADLPGMVELYTEDGTVGRKGMVSAGVSARLAEREYAAVLTCGPDAMMEAVADACFRAGVRCQASLDSRMACGLGFCRGCVRVGSGGRNLCVCTDGPVFEAAEVYGGRDGV